MNPKERKVLEIIEENPFISQKDIAEELELTRSTVATIISSLTNKNQLLGRAYVVNRSKNVYCIGAMNVDRKFNLTEKMVLKTSNPAVSSVSIGGVIRNIAENLGRLDYEPSLFSLGGLDQDFNIIKKATEPYVNMQHVSQVSRFSTGMYNAILDTEGEMQLAIADMEINEEMSRAWIKQYESILIEAELLVIDLNLPYETVEYLIHLARTHEVDLIVIPVSGPKMKRLPKDLTGVNWLIVNQDESESYFDLKVENEGDFENLVEHWLGTGLKNVVITRGIKPSAYGNQAGERLSLKPPKVNRVIDVTGAGDGYSAGVIMGHLEGLSPKESIQLGMTNSYHIIQEENNVRQELSKERLYEEKNQLFNNEGEDK
ncbi:MAG: winged helix-turn-helix transcriptional regulator [Atopostipes suicloacalis]|nr:winged helix-turn-helix transcriptional regulator [Atopostipes suicloacalis]MDN6731031.1 winged helix-turn-helix transcriptional regulator [Atopostipes suicloacalis]